MGNIYFDINDEYDDFDTGDDDYFDNAPAPDYYVVTDADLVVYDNGTVDNYPRVNVLFDHLHDEFNKHYNHDNDDYRVAAAINFVNSRDYDNLVTCTGTDNCPLLYDDNHRRYHHDSVTVYYDDNGEHNAPARCHCGRYNPCRHHDHYDFYDHYDEYVNAYHDGDLHLVNKHHNYD
jgi:hypothetical protein